MPDDKVNLPGFKVPRPIQAIGAVLVLLSGILGSISEITSGFLTLNNKVPTFVVWGVAALLVALGTILLLRSVRTPISEVDRRATVGEGAVERQDLIGRDDDLEHLRRGCLQARLIFLVGDSGVGKSALLRAGLCDALRVDSVLLPVYQDRWGLDWEEGPRRALLEALWSTLRENLSAAERMACNVPELMPEPSELVGLFSAIHNGIHRRVLVIFDQFDDYQAEHRERLLPENGREALGMRALQDHNAFWKDIATLVAADVIRCVFATRRDVQLGLESIRFVEPLVFHLQRLDEEDARRAFDAVFIVDGKRAIPTSAPEGTWRSLKARFIADLLADGGGTVLPAQLRVAAKGLLDLPELSVEAYERAGGFLGLEVGHLRRCLASAASAADIDEALGRRILERMITPGTPRPKGRPAQSDDLAAVALPEATYAELGAAEVGRRVKVFLERLERYQIVRPVPYQDVHAEYWTIYHDYLARTVRALVRSADKWTTTLEEASADYSAAHSALDRWRNLLPIGTQLRLLLMRVSSSSSREVFRYGRHRRYALLSAFRAVPMVVLLLATGIGAVRWVRVERARSMFERFSPDRGFPTQRDVENLWELTTTDRAVQRAIFERALASPDLSERLGRGASMITHAVVGMNATARAEIETLIRSRCMDLTHLDRRVSTTCARTIVALESEIPDLVEVATRVMLDLLIAGEDDPSASQNGQSLLQELRRLHLLSKVREPTAHEIGGLALAQANPSRSPETLRRLCDAVTALPATWNTKELLPAVQAIAQAPGDNISARERITLQWKLLTKASTPSDLFTPIVASLEQLAPSTTKPSQIGLDDGTAVDDESFPPPPPPPPRDPADDTQMPIPTAESASAERVLIILVEHIERATPVERRSRLATALSGVIPSLAFIGRRDDVAERLKLLRAASPSSGSTSRRSSEPDAAEREMISAYQEAAAQARAKLEKMRARDIAEALARITKMIEVQQTLERALRAKSIDPALPGLLHDTFHPRPELGIAVFSDLSEPNHARILGASNSEQERRWLEALFVGGQALRAVSRRDPRPSVEESLGASQDLSARLPKLLAQFEAGDRSLQWFAFAHLKGTLKAQEVRDAAQRIVAVAERSMPVDVEPYQELLAPIVRAASEKDRAERDATFRALVEIITDESTTVRGAVILCGAMARCPMAIDGGMGLSNAKLAAERVATMVQDAKPSDVQAAGEALRLLSKLIIDADAPYVANLVLGAMERTNDPSRFDALRRAVIGKVEEGADPERVTKLLKWPTCVGLCRSNLLGILNHASNHESGLSYWGAVDWARKKGFNVDAPPSLTRHPK